MTQPAQNTIVRFGIAIDDHDLDGLVSLFTDDATLEVADRPGPQKGTQEIRDFFSAIIDLRWQGQHSTSPAVLEVDGDEATFIANYTYLRFEGGFHVQTAGRYEGVLRRTGVAWKFGHLSVRVLSRN